ncbi:MAG: MerR family transcriptional regulator, partial [Devosia sp.]
MRDYAIGELSALSGVKVPTIRYYEEIGILPPPPRTDGNQRRYGEAALDRLRFIAHARSMGFPMES